MLEAIRILTVERDGDEGLIVAFSDGTSAGYVVEELLDLRPGREPAQTSKDLISPMVDVGGLKLVPSAR
jgi:hypothetical protein